MSQLSAHRGGTSGYASPSANSANDLMRTRDQAVGRAYLLLKTLFTVAPIVFGLDKFTNVLTHWDGYLAPWIDSIVPGTAAQAMYAVGIVEIAAGILVFLRPRLGSLVVAAWLAGIVVNLLTFSGFYDIALRDAGLLVAAVALHLLATARRVRS